MTGSENVYLTLKFCPQISSFHQGKAFSGSSAQSSQAYMWVLIYTKFI